MYIPSGKNRLKSEMAWLKSSESEQEENKNQVHSASRSAFLYIVFSLVDLLSLLPGMAGPDAAGATLHWCSQHTPQPMHPLDKNPVEKDTAVQHCVLYCIVRTFCNQDNPVIRTTL